MPMGIIITEQVRSKSKVDANRTRKDFIAERVLAMAEWSENRFSVDKTSRLSITKPVNGAIMKKRYCRYRKLVVLLILDRNTMNLEIPDNVDIYFGHNLAGKLFSNDGVQVRSTFEYDDNYSGPALSPQLPVDIKKHTTIGLFSCFEDATADGYGRTLINTEYGVKSLIEYEYFALSTDIDRQGAIRASHLGDFIMPATKLRRNLHMRTVFENNAEDYIAEHLKLTCTYGTSVGGMQPKISAVDDDGALFIIKTTTYDPRSNVAFEATALDLARSLGINTEWWRFVPGEKSIDNVTFPDALIVKRFDRVVREQGIVERIPYISAKTMLAGMPYTYVNLAAQLIPDDREELYKRALFNIIIHNYDDHEKNHGFLMNKHGEWRLSPAFDIMPFELRNPGFTIMADRLDDRSVERLVAVHEHFDISKEKASEYANQFEIFIRENWLTVAIKYMTEEQAMSRQKYFSPQSSKRSSNVTSE
jgi:serine/threonine-protein kinase HipA